MAAARKEKILIFLVFSLKNRINSFGRFFHNRLAYERNCIKHIGLGNISHSVYASELNVLQKLFCARIIYMTEEYYYLISPGNECEHMAAYKN